LIHFNIKIITLENLINDIKLQINNNKFRWSKYKSNLFEEIKLKSNISNSSQEELSSINISNSIIQELIKEVDKKIKKKKFKILPYLEKKKKDLEKLVKSSNRNKRRKKDHDSDYYPSNQEEDEYYDYEKNDLQKELNDLNNKEEYDSDKSDDDVDYIHFTESSMDEYEEIN
jgi:hypothetical protein